jgi:hypothetical protein
MLTPMEFSSMAMRVRIQLLALLEHFNWELFDHPP